jgi:hypothetical protein
VNIYQQILDDENLRVKVILPEGYGKAPDQNSSRDDSVIIGYLENPFILNASADWNDKLFGTDYASRVNEFFQRMGGNVKLQTILDTQQQYMIARIPQFDLSFYIVSANSSINPIKKVSRLFEAIYPFKQTDGSIQFHWGYRANALGERDNKGNKISELQRSPTDGTVILTIGKWFRALNLIIKDVRTENSEVCNHNGTPYWIKVSITFSPRRLPYSDEYISMFITNPNSMGG